MVSCFHSILLVPLQIREGRKQSLPECLKKEFRLTINILRATISGDVYEVVLQLCQYFITGT